jgi:hypothetical protein
MSGALGMEYVSLKRLSMVGLWGGLLYWGPRKMLGLLFLGARGYWECTSGGPGTMVR